MATWSDYKNHVREVDPEIAKDIDEVEALSQIVGSNNNLDSETVAALNEYPEMKDHPEKYKRYSSFREAMKEVLSDT